MASIFYYLCVVTLQYVAPIIMCLYFALMYKTLGDYKWTDLYKTILPDDECGIDAFDPAVTTKAVEQVVQKVQDQFAEFVITDEVEVAPESMMNSARMSLDGLKAVCSKFLISLIHSTDSFFIYFFRYSQLKCIGGFLASRRGGVASFGLLPLH